MAASNLPLVTVIVPTYNRPALLQQTLASVLAQTYPALEIIVVDDGSTDETATLLETYRGRVQVIRQANRGLSAARNRGIAAAQGVFLTFLDDDDLIAPTKIARQAHLLHTRPELGLVHCGYYHSDGGGQLLDKVWLFPEGDTLPQLVQGNYIWSGAPLVRRTCLDQVGGFDSSLPQLEDWDMWLRLAQAGCRFAAVSMPLGTYRLRHNNMSADLDVQESCFLTLMERFFASEQLPAPVAAAKTETYSSIHLWLACRGYAGEQIAFGQKHLEKALNWQPRWQTQPEEMMGRLLQSSLNPRIAQPVPMAHSLFEHLPASAQFLQPYRNWLLGWTSLAQAMRHLAIGETNIAQELAQQALASYPALAHQAAELVPFLVKLILALPVAEPREYAAAVLSTLLPAVHNTPTLRNRILSDVLVGLAFQAYFAGERVAVSQRILAAVRHRPAVLKNRGVWAIWAKSWIGKN